MQILSHRPQPGALLSTLDDDDKTLSYFCVGDGSEVRGCYLLWGLLPCDWLHGTQRVFFFTSFPEELPV